MSQDFEPGEGGPNSGVTPRANYATLLRSYEDAPEIERVWERLDARRRAPRGGALRFALAAIVLLGLGFGLGRTSQSWAPETLVALGDRPAVQIAAEERAVAPSGPRAEPEVSREANSRQPETLRTSRPRSVARPAPLTTSEESSEVTEVLLPHERETPAWTRMAEQGNYSGAFSVLDESGELGRLVAEGSAEELMTLADVARFAGRTGWAIQILREVTTRHSEDENAPLAAMTLGNLLDRAGDAEGASRAYALTRRLAPYGDFAEDALVREFMMACGAREHARAARLLAEYESLHPGGARHEEMSAALALLGNSEPPAPGVERDIWGGDDHPGSVEIEQPEGGPGSPPSAAGRNEAR